MYWLRPSKLKHDAVSSSLASGLRTCSFFFRRAFSGYFLLSVEIVPDVVFERFARSLGDLRGVSLVIEDDAIFIRAS